MKRNQVIILVLVTIALVQMACSMPAPQQAVETPVSLTPTNGPAVITATASAPATATATTPPTATSTQVPTVVSGGNNNTTTSCSFLATFITDVSIPDDTRVSPGASFTKTWRVRNDGTCTWGAGRSLHALAFTGGSRLGSVEQISLPANVAPGQTVDLSVDMVAPVSAGTYTSEWKFRVDGVNGVGPYLGVGPSKTGALYARIIVGATPTPTSTTTSPSRINFAPGATSTSVEGSVKAGGTRSYLVGALKDQLLMASFASAVGDLRLRIVEVSTGNVLIAVAGTSTQVYLPSNGDYLVEILGGGADANFILAVQIPRRITFEPGSISASEVGTISNRTPVLYLLRAQAGQTMTVKLTSPSNGVALTIYGIEDGQPLVRSDFGLMEWSGNLNLTQDYMIMVVPSVEATTFTMTVTIQ